MTADIIERAIGRNETSIEASNDGLVFVKKIIGPDADAERRYRNCLAFDAAQSSSMPVEVSPPLRSTDDEARRLVYPYLTDAHSLQDELSDWAVDGWSAEHPFVAAAERAAELLGVIHSLPTSAVDPVTAAMRPDPGDGPIRRFEWLTVDEYANASGGELGCWRLFHHDRELREAVRRWCVGQSELDEPATVHGDVRPDQFVVTGDHVVILDWEEFGVGSPTRDVAGVVGAVVFEVLRETFASASTDSSGPLDVHERFLERGAENLRAVGPVIARFVEVYGLASVHEIPGSRLSVDVGFYLLERVIGRSMIQASMRAVDRAIGGVARAVLLSPELLSVLIDEEM